MKPLSEIIGREPCCDEDLGGSHYHCGRCGGVSSMMGHSQGVHWNPTEKVPQHFCCPNDCQLENLEELEAKLAERIEIFGEDNRFTQEARDAIEWNKKHGSSTK